MATAATERFELGRVVVRATGAVRRNLLLFLALAGILQLGPALITQLLVPTAVGPGALPAFGPGALLGSLISFALFYVLQAAVTHVTVVDLKDEKPTLGPALARGVQLALPLLGLAIVSGFAIVLGLVLIVVPGIILASMWLVAVPAMVEEDTGVFASLARSSILTRGSRGRIFLMLLVLLVTFYAALFGVSAVFGTVNAVGGSGFASASASIGGAGVGGIVIAVFNTVFVIGITTLIAATYVELRYVREGDAGLDVAAVFD